MNTAPAPAGLVPRLSFGFAGKIKESLSYNEDGSYVYPSGHNVVFLAPDGRSQRFVQGTPDCEGITAIALSPNKKLLAVAERAEKAIISIYDTQSLKRRKVLQATEVGSKEYVSLSFSSDGKLLLAQGGRPDWNLLLWFWEKSKVASSARASNTPGNPIAKASLSHGENHLVTVVGQGVLKMFKVSEGVLKPLPLNANKRDTLNFTCHSWMNLDKEGGSDKDQRQLMGTTDGEILLFEGTEPRANFTGEPGCSVEAIASYSKGFVVGQSGGLVTLFERDDREYYRRARCFGVHEHPQRILSLAISLNEEQLVLGLESGSAWTLALSNTELMKPEDHNFELLGGGGHSSVVTGLDMCIRRPLLATCSSDHTVRLWNYVERSCELAKTFAEEAHSVAIHPTGLMILVGFTDKLRLMSILMDDFKLLKELPIKACRDVAFSNGGHLFAAVNGLTVSIYNAYTCENLGNLRGHNGKVRSIGWSADDTRLVSAGMDGAVYEWRLSDLKRDKESVLKGCQYNAAVMTPEAKTLIGAGSDRKIREIEDTAGTGATAVRDVDLGTAGMVTALALPFGGKVLFAGTDTGIIRAYRFPLTGEFYEIKAMEGPVTRLRVSYDDCTLAATGEDGSLILLDIRDKELIKASSRREQERLAWLEEVLVSKAELEERKSRINELEQAVAELTMQTEYQLRLKDLHVQEKLKELSEKAAGEVEAERAKLEALTREKLEAEVEAEEKLKALEARSGSQLGALDAQYQSRMMAEVERYQQLLQEKEALNERWDEQNSLLVESHERVISELTEEYEAKLAEEVLKLEALKQEKQALEREAGEVKKQQEEDADREIEELKDKYEARLATEREGALRLKGEAGILRKKFQGLQKELEEQRESLAAQHEQQKDLYATIKGLEKDIASLKREIRERDDTIGEKERRIYELKKKNQELEKFKFVLDYKIKELKKQIEPREVEIQAMKETVRAMDAELERYHKSHATLDLTISNLKLKQTGLMGEVTQQRNAKSNVAESHKRLLAEVTSLAAYIQDPKALKEQVKQLYQRHCQGSGPVAAVDEEVNQEYARQRQYLERTVDGLKRKLAADVETHRVEGLKVMQQNVALIKEINELRREIKNLKTGSLPRSTTASGGNLTGYLTGSLRASKATTALSASTALKTSHSTSPSPNLTSALSKGRDAGMSAGQQQQLAKLQQQQAEILAEAEAEQQQLRRELEMQRDLIERLRAELDAKGEMIVALEASSSAAGGGVGRERLPSLGHPAVFGMDGEGAAAVVTAPLDDYGGVAAAAPARSGSSSGRPSTANPSSRRTSAVSAKVRSVTGSRTVSASGAVAAAVPISEEGEGQQGWAGDAAAEQQAAQQLAEAVAAAAAEAELQEAAEEAPAAGIGAEPSQSAVEVSN